jgi:hypothetical protein
MLGATRLNYAICLHLLKLLRDLDRDDAAAPRPEDLPPLISAITDATAFAAVGPSSRIAGFPELPELATKAFAEILSINLWFQIEIWLPMRGYYSKARSRQSLDRAAASSQLKDLAESRYREAEQFEELPSLLRDLALRTEELGLNRFSDFWRVRQDGAIVELRNNLSALLHRVTESSPAANAT